MPRLARIVAACAGILAAFPAGWRHYRSYIWTCSFNLLVSYCDRELCPDSVGPEQAVAKLFARRAGVHIDLHANLHFKDLRCLPRHKRLASQRHHCRGKNMVVRRRRWLRGAMPSDSHRQWLDAEWGLFDDTRHTVSPRSSAISSPPDRSTAKPTGLPRA
jgi:hypothetical protein